MRIFAKTIGLFCLLSAGAAAQTALQPPLASLSFLLGHWTGADGKVAETGGTSRGNSTITAEAGGAVLLRRDQVQLFAAGGNQTGSFGILMTIYADNGAIHADYADGTHLIHYVSANIKPDQSVAFMSAPGAGRPVFRLQYSRVAPERLSVTFSMQPPGQTTFQPIATGILRKEI
jgi:hypothetical protein